MTLVTPQSHYNNFRPHLWMKPSSPSEARPAPWKPGKLPPHLTLNLPVPAQHNPNCLSSPPQSLHSFGGQSDWSAGSGRWWKCLQHHGKCCLPIREPSMREVEEYPAGLLHGAWEDSAETRSSGSGLRIPKAEWRKKWGSVRSCVLKTRSEELVNEAGTREGLRRLSPGEGTNHHRKEEPGTGPSPSKRSPGSYYC